MAYLRALGCYLPSRVVGNAELGTLVGADPAWILQATGIEERRFAAADQSVATLGALAAKDCLESAGIGAGDVGLILVSSGSSGRRFPGPASAIGSALGIAGTAAIDLPLASAGGLFGVALAARLCRDYGNVLVVATEIMSRAVRMDSSGRDTAILFGDGAGACLVSAERGFAESPIRSCTATANSPRRCAWISTRRSTWTAGPSSSRRRESCRGRSWNYWSETSETRRSGRIPDAPGEPQPDHPGGPGVGRSGANFSAMWVDMATPRRLPC